MQGGFGSADVLSALRSLITGYMAHGALPSHPPASARTAVYRAPSTELGWWRVAVRPGTPPSASSSANEAEEVGYMPWGLVVPQCRREEGGRPE